MLQLGVIADDFTGASDIASFLTENGLRTVQMNGIPARALPDGVDAVVISLKSRSIAAQEAIAQSLSALQWLQAAGCKQFFFKYCSTFDSTAAGNIGPVTDALLDALGEDFTVISPALPVNGRTIFNGYLFVGQVLLNESGMQNHPITPMRDASLPRLMDAQARGKTGLVAYPDMVQGAAHVRDCFARLRADGYRYAVADSVDNAQLAVLAEACRDLRLVTGGSGLGAYLAALLSGGKKGDNAFVPKKGATVVLSGSCSVMTNKQVATYKTVAPRRRPASSGARTMPPNSPPGSSAIWTINTHRCSTPPCHRMNSKPSSSVSVWKNPATPLSRCLPPSRKSCARRVWSISSARAGKRPASSCSVSAWTASTSASKLPPACRGCACSMAKSISR